MEDKVFTDEEFSKLVFKEDGIDKDFLKQWINIGCIIEEKCGCGLCTYKPIHWAAKNGRLDIVKYLMDNGADITTDNNYAVQMAAENGRLDMVKYLVEKGADITVRDNCVVRWAAVHGYLDVVKYLVEKGADITARDNLAVQWAAVDDHLDVVKYLLNTFIYPEEIIHEYASAFKDNIIIYNLMANYRQFSYVKAIK